MILLKQSTAATLRVGPFVDAEDGVTPETGVSLSGADQAEILKASGGVVDIAGATWAAITGCAGWYDLSLTTGYTDTVGMLTVIVQDESVCLPVFVRAMVVPATIWDALVGGTAPLPVNVTQFGGTNGTFSSGRPEVNTTHWAGTAVGSATVNSNVTQISGDSTAADNLESYCDGTTPQPVNVTQISGDSTAADNLESYCDGTTPQPVNVTQFGGNNGTFASGVPAVNATQISGDSGAADNLETAFDDTAGQVPWTGIVEQGTAQSATATTVVLRSGASATDNYYRGGTLVITGGSTGVGLRVPILSYEGSSRTATVPPFVVTPTGTIGYKIHGTPEASADAPVPTNVVSVAGEPVTEQAGQNFVSFFDNEDAATDKVVDDVGEGSGGGGATAEEVWTFGTRVLTAGTNIGTVSANVTQISGDSTAADNLEAACDGTGYNLGGGSVVAASVTGAVGSVTGNVGGTVNGLTSTAQGHVRTAVGLNSANLDTQLSTIDSEVGAIDTVVDAIKVTTDKLDGMIEDSSGNRFTEKALEEAPGGGGGTDVNVVSWNGDPVGNETFAGIAIPHVSVVGIKGTALGDDEGPNFSTFFANGDASSAVVLDDIASVKSTVEDLDANGVTVTTNNDKTGYRLSSTGVDDILDEAVEGSVTLRQSIRLANSALGGKASGLDSTSVTYRDLADSKNRISATVDADGNRTAVTRDLT